MGRGRDGERERWGEREREEERAHTHTHTEPPHREMFDTIAFGSDVGFLCFSMESLAPYIGICCCPRLVGCHLSGNLALVSPSSRCTIQVRTSIHHGSKYFYGKGHNLILSRSMTAPQSPLMDLKLVRVITGKWTDVVLKRITTVTPVKACLPWDWMISHRNALVTPTLFT